MTRLAALRTPPTAVSPSGGSAHRRGPADTDTRTGPEQGQAARDAGHALGHSDSRRSVGPSSPNGSGRHHIPSGTTEVTDSAAAWSGSGAHTGADDDIDIDAEVSDADEIDADGIGPEDIDPEDIDADEPAADHGLGWFLDLPEWRAALVSEQSAPGATATSLVDATDGDVGVDIEVDDTDENPAPSDATAAAPAEASQRQRASPAAGGRRTVRAPRVARTWGRFAELWIPEPLREARVDPGRRGAWILLLVAAVAAVVTAVGVWRDRPEPVSVTGTGLASFAAAATSGTHLPGTASPSNGRPTPGVSGSAVAAAASPTASGHTGPIIVSVTGLVGKPGVVTLPDGSRVADAIAAAGGADPQADVTGMNLAARLADGDSVVVGATPAVESRQVTTNGGSLAGAATADAAVPPGALIDLNSADAAALDTLPGVGPVMAANILAWRLANGRFTSVEQLQEISGIGPSRFAQISALVTVS